ncbi:MAG: transcription termination factor NusA [Candidatus Dormibacteria bacterium]
MSPVSGSSPRLQSGALDLGHSLRQLQERSGLPSDELLAVVTDAVSDAWAAIEGGAPPLAVALEAETGRLLVQVTQRVVAGEAESSSQLALAEALAVDQKAQPGDLLSRPIDLPPPVLARAAQLAKVRLGRWLKENHQRQLVGEAEEHRGQLVDSIVERTDGGTWFLRAGALQAVLSPEEQIPRERLQRGQHLKVVLLESRRGGGEEYLQVRASRTSPLLLRRLLESEVPELGEGTLVLRSVTREPGERAKVAVESLREEVDAKGACIGLRGVRIRAVVALLAGEKIDVLEWSADPAVYVARALAPAPVLVVRIDEESRRATVMVAPEVLSLAIGREGQNARLAARLTGWRIDIHAAGAELPAPA